MKLIAFIRRFTPPVLFRAAYPLIIPVEKDL